MEVLYNVRKYLDPVLRVRTNQTAGYKFLINGQQIHFTLLCKDVYEELSC